MESVNRCLRFICFLCSHRSSIESAFNVDDFLRLVWPVLLNRLRRCFPSGRAADTSALTDACTLQLSACKGNRFLKKDLGKTLAAIMSILPVDRFNQHLQELLEDIVRVVSVIFFTRRCWCTMVPVVIMWSSVVEWHSTTFKWWNAKQSSIPSRFPKICLSVPSVIFENR